MPKRYLSIWLPYLATDSMIKHHPELKDKPFVLSVREKNSLLVGAVNPLAAQEGITVGKGIADARAILPALEVFDDEPAARGKVLESLAEWCLRFSPLVSVDAPDGIMIDISGCSHLWGGEVPHVETIVRRLSAGGYQAKVAISDTIGAAWAEARFGSETIGIIKNGEQATALAVLPPEALRLDSIMLHRMRKLGFRTISQFMDMPSVTLRRRFGTSLLQRLGQAMGNYPEVLKPVQPIEPYRERLTCLEPICTAQGIEIALLHLLEQLCKRLKREGNGIRTAVFKGYRMDGYIQEISVGTSRASHSEVHLFHLFELKIPTIEPALGIELFVLEASLVEEVGPAQEALWDNKADHSKVAELLDNIAGKVGVHTIQRYLPVEQHWPERSIKATASLDEKISGSWPTDKWRPLHLLAKPEPIDVMVPLPDYPPMLFTHKGKVFKLIKADGPERIEQEWWLEDGQSRDYYRVEDEKGARYWLFRLGHYADGAVQWFLHGFFA